MNANPVGPLVSGAGAVGNTVLTFVTFVEKQVDSHFERQDLRQGNPEHLVQLEKLFESLSHRIDALQKECDQNVVANLMISPHLQSCLKEGLDEVKERVKSTLERCVELKEAMKKRLKWRPKGVRKQLNELDGTATEFKQFVKDTFSTLVDMRKEGNSIGRASAQGFRVVNMVPKNPRGMVFDFTSKVNGKFATCEGRLREAVMQDGSDSLIGAVAVGMGGVGKSCALRALGWDKEMEERFSGGILYMSVGKDANVGTIIERLGEIVERAGGREIAERVRMGNILEKAVRKTAEWFGERRCLFLIDDIWCENGIKKEIVMVFSELVCNRYSRVVYTSRDERITDDAGTRVEFKAREARGDIARAMLLSHSELFDSESVEHFDEENREAFDGLLDLCGGLPVALAIAGASVRKAARSRGSCKEGAWSWYYKRVKNDVDKLTAENTTRYGILKANILTSLDVLDCREEGRFAMSFKKMFRGLSAVGKQQNVPPSMLWRLWDLENEDEAMEVMNIMEELSFGELQYDKMYGSTMGLHDLLLDIADSEATRQKENWAKKLIDRYETSYSPSMCCTDEYREWWNVDKEKDMHLYRNLFRYLTAGGLVEEASLVLLDPRWTVKQIRTGGIKQVLDDYDLVTEAVRRQEKQNTELDETRQEKLSGWIQALELIKEAVSLASTYVSRNEKEVWFQLHGRLIGSKEIAEIGKYLEKIMVHAEKPWVQSEGVNLLQAGRALRRSWTVEGFVQDASFGPNGSVIVLHQSDGLLRKKCEVRKFEQHDEGKGTILWIAECEAPILNGVLSNDGRKLALFVGENTGIVKVCDIESKKEVHCEGRAHNGNIRCMAYCEDGDTLAFVSDDNRVGVWNHEGTKMCMIREVRCEEEVMCIGLSGNGRKLAVGCKDGRVKVVDIDHGNVGTWFVAGSIYSVACSRDGRIATFSREGYISVWSVENERKNEQTKISVNDSIHGYGFMLLWSPDSRILGFVMYVGKKMRLWNMSCAPHEITCAGLEYKSHVIHALRWSTDSTKVVACCNGTTAIVVRVRSMCWTQLRGCSEGEMSGVSEDEELQLQTVRWSGDGSTLATLSRDSVHNQQVWLCDSHGRRHADGEVRWEPSELSWVRELAWASERALLALVGDEGVLLWDTQRRERVGLLRMLTREQLDLGPVRFALSADGASAAMLCEYYDDGLGHNCDLPFLLAALRPRHYRLLLWNTSAAGIQPPRVVNVYDGHCLPIAIACSADGVVACLMQCRRNIDMETEGRVYDCNGVLLASMGMQERFLTRAFSFDAQDSVLIEWNDGRLPQFSVWRWQQQQQQQLNAPEPLQRTAPHLGGNRTFDACLDPMTTVYSAHHAHLATLEYVVPEDTYFHDYNENANAFAVVRENAPHIYHLHS